SERFPDHIVCAYNLLGLNTKATEEEVEIAYHLKLQAARIGSTSDAEAFNRIIKAYQNILDAFSARASRDELEYRRQSSSSTPGLARIGSSCRTLSLSPDDSRAGGGESRRAIAPVSPCSPSLGAAGNAQVGDLLRFQRGLYSHWGLYVGRLEACARRRGRRWQENPHALESIVHFSGPGGSETDGNARVIHTPLRQVQEYWNAEIANFLDKEQKAVSIDAALDRAFSALGGDFGGYHLIDNNCEHFVTWARYGIKRSAQVDSAIACGSMAMAGMAVGGPVGAVVGGIIGNVLSSPAEEAPKVGSSNSVQESTLTLPCDGNPHRHQVNRPMDEVGTAMGSRSSICPRKEIFHYWHEAVHECRGQEGEEGGWEGEKTAERERGEG
ncbi:hypothetical protein CYMTET_34227, partial [Cymbomonas tetramitiformis]